MTKKQRVFWKNAVLTYHRWSIATGATRSGKTYLSYFYIPKKVRQLKGKPGLCVIIGNTHTTIERNILEPMRELYGDKLVGNVNSQNKVYLFGQLFHVLGAEKKNAVTKIQGQAIKLCIGDEVTTWHPDVFAMLKSRLDKDYSCFYGTCNPDHPKHWLKEFLDSDADIYHQHYTIDDNTYLSSGFISALKKEYAGTVYWFRFILGLWVRAEGVIYPKFSADPESFIIEDDQLPDFQEINIGIDFGGTKSGQAFVATGIERGYKGIVALESERWFGEIDPVKLEFLATEFGKKVLYKYGRIDYVFCDSAESVLIRGIRNAYNAAKLPGLVKNAIKKPINDRIKATVFLMNLGRFKITRHCETLKEALADAVWNEKKLVDERLDDGSTDVDSLDGFEYTWEKDITHLLDVKTMR